MRLDPGFSQQYLHFLGLAHLVAGHYETAAVYFKERILLVPSTDFSRAFLASALGHLGNLDEARQIWRDLKQVNPKYSFDNHTGRLPFEHAADVQRICGRARQSGFAGLTAARALVAARLDVAFHDAAVFHVRGHIDAARRRRCRSG